MRRRLVDTLFRFVAAAATGLIVVILLGILWTIVAKGYRELNWTLITKMPSADFNLGGAGGMADANTFGAAPQVRENLNIRCRFERDRRVHPPEKAQHSAESVPLIQNASEIASPKMKSTSPRRSFRPCTGSCSRSRPSRCRRKSAGGRHAPTR